jgi:anti-sigma regulatory factor (Ser/Thr protein kinase)
MDAFVARLPCEVSRLAALRRDLNGWLAETDLPDRVRSSVVLATHEAAANAIEHATPCESVEVRAAIDEETSQSQLGTQGYGSTPTWTTTSADAD